MNVCRLYSDKQYKLSFGTNTKFAGNRLPINSNNNQNEMNIMLGRAYKSAIFFMRNKIETLFLSRLQQIKPYRFLS